MPFQTDSSSSAAAIPAESSLSPDDAIEAAPPLTAISWSDGPLMPRDLIQAMQHPSIRALVALPGAPAPAAPTASAVVESFLQAATASPAPANRPRYRTRSIAVVVPAYDEEVLVGDTLASIPAFVCRIYAVNDASKDRTAAVIAEHAANDPRIALIDHETNRGVGAAIVTGYRQALEDGMDIVAVMAGDNQMDPAFLPELLDPIVDGTADYTIGNRLMSPAYRKGMSAWRFVGNAALTMLTKIASGYWQMMDPQNGYTAISRRALERIDLDAIYPRYGYCNDVLVKLNVYGFRIKNIPHPARYGREKSGINYSTYILKVSRLLLKDFMWRLKFKYIVMSFHPLVFYYAIGAVLSTIGLVGGLHTLYEKLILGEAVLFVHGTLSLLVFTLGMMFLLFAMLFDMQQERSSGGWY